MSDTSQFTPVNIALAGCGKMGSALLSGWLMGAVTEKLSVLDPGGLPDAFEEFVPNRVTFFDNPALFTAARPPIDFLVLAVKPQTMSGLCEIIAPAVPPGALILSIAAGIKIGSYEHYFGADRAVARAMPNTPAAIGQGITALCANAHVTAAQKIAAQKVMSVLGPVEWITDENLMDAVTAVSGSGPAYVFLLIETLAAAGVKAGLDKALAMRLARQTIIGSAALAATDHADAATLRKNVTSPGGTTEAALDILMDGSFQTLFDRTIDAAIARGRSLSKP